MATCGELTERYLLCSICGDVYNKPTTLPCGHTMCFTCIVTHAQNNEETRSKKAIPCPFCRHWNKIPNAHYDHVHEWVAQFKPNIALQDMVHTFHRQEKCCSKCENTEIEVYCTRCQQALCSKCKEHHNKVTKDTDHKVVILKQASPSTQNVKDGVCYEHPKQSLELFCHSCNKPICPMCGSLTHKNCNDVVLLSTLTKSMESSIAEDEKKIKIADAVVRNQATSTQKQLDTFIKHAEQLIHDVKQKADLFRDMISEKENVLVNRLVGLKSVHGLKLSSKIDNGVIASRMVHETLQNTSQEVKHYTNYELYEKFQSIKDRYTETQHNLQSIIESNVEPPEIIFESDPTLFEHFQQLELGVVSTKVPIGTSTKRAILLDRKTANIDLTVDIKVIKVNGRDVVVGISPCSRCIYSFYLDAPQATTNKLFTDCESWGLCQISPDHVLISNQKIKRMLIIVVEPELSIVRSLRTEKTYQSVAALDVNVMVANLDAPPTDVNVMVASSDAPPSVDILDMSGMILKSFDNTNIRGEIFSSPNYICINRDSNILISDCRKKTLTCLSFDGTVLFRFPPQEEEAALQSPQGVAVDKDGYIFVVDDTKQIVLQLTRTGNFVREVAGTEIIHCPSGICFDSKGNMLVAHGNEVWTFEFR